MGEWFNERFISRDEHQNIVAYYRKLVAKLHCNVRDLRAQADARADMADEQQSPAEDKRQELSVQIPQGGNVIRFNFRRKS